MIAACLVVASSVSPWGILQLSAGTSSSATITVVATTDLHGQLETLPWLAGYLRVMRDLRRRDQGAVLLVDAGDMWQGTLASNLTEGATVVRAYNALGYAAAAIGNHEFDFGPVGPEPVSRKPGDNPRGALEARARDAHFPFLAANIREGERPWAPVNVRASHLTVVAGVKVGIVGVTTSHTPDAADTRNFVDLRFGPLAEAVVPKARSLRARGASLVIVLAHAGGRCEAWDDPLDLSHCDATAEIFALANALPPGLVDVIAAGNTHEGIAHRVNGIAVVQAFSRGRAFARVDVRVDRGTGKVQDVRIHSPYLVCSARPSTLASERPADACASERYEGRPVTPDPALDHLIRRDLDRARAIRARPIGVAVSHRFDNAYSAESPAGNLVVDLLRAARPGADAAIYHAGGTRASLEAGPVTYGAVYDLVPFDSVLATATLSAGQLSAALTRGLSHNILPTVSGLRVVASCDGTTPHVSLFRGGRELRPDETLSVVTSEYLAFGGAVVFEGTSKLFAIEASEPMRDAIVRILPAARTAIDAGEIGVVDAAAPRVALPGGLPLHCAS